MEATAVSNLNRQRGDHLERSAKRALEAEGWVVCRAAGSLGPFDLMALRGFDTPLLIACKTTRAIGPGERRAVVAAANAAGAVPVLATRTQRGWVALYRIHLDAIGNVIRDLRVPSRASGR